MKFEKKRDGSRHLTVLAEVILKRLAQSHWKIPPDTPAPPVGRYPSPPRRERLTFLRKATGGTDQWTPLATSLPKDKSV